MANGKTPKPIGRDADAIRIREDRMKAALESRGNIVPFINTFRELSDKEKADFYDDFFVRKRQSGKLPKNNPWR